MFILQINYCMYYMKNKEYKLNWSDTLSFALFILIKIDSMHAVTCPE